MPKTKRYALRESRLATLGPGTHTDGGGLTLRVDGSGKRRWVLRTTIDGKRINRGLGTYPAVTLSAARAKARTKSRAAPVRRQPRTPAAPTFEDTAMQVIALRRPTWSSDRHAEQWLESLTNHAFPTIGDKPVNEITTADVLLVLTPIWTALPETATRVRQRMGVIFDYATVSGWRADNPAAAVSKALPRRPRVKRHHPALPYADVPAAVKAIQGSTAKALTRLALEFMILTAARAGEVRGATWAEIDGHTWTIPADRMKMRREHRVPLSGRCMAILSEARAITGDGALIFANGKPLTNMAFSMLLRRLAIDCVPHGFRSSFRDWTISETSASWAIGEAALAHSLGNSLESAYARTDLFEQRQALMKQWADYMAG